jgi:methylenetetrahydrofolate dehydrogenase (NADP+)/methenyltetrahydrofolate cyclohydrolase
MPARILDGKALANAIEESLCDEVAAFTTAAGRAARLVVVLVGEIAASASYVAAKARAAARVGIDADVIRVAGSADTAALVALISGIARGSHGPVDGILVQLPLPRHVDTLAVLDAVPADRDVDGFHPENAGLLSQWRPRFIPCTAAGVQRLLVDAGIATAGRRAVIVGRSDIVGKPLALLLSARGPGGDATVTICHSHTADLAEHCRTADILVAAVGRPGLITAEMVKPGATVIDVGINRVETPTGSRLVGDVDFSAVATVAGAITPVPGGVGPLTVAMLLANTLLAAELRIRRR